MSDTPRGPGDDGSDDTGEADEAAGVTTEAETTTDLADLRETVEERYDFDDFGPDQMARMSGEEWEAAFDSDSWITGERLIDRVERDLKSRVASRDVFARVERIVGDDGRPRIAAWSDEGHVVVHPDGTVEGAGTVLRDVEPSVALCSMEDYDVDDPPEEFGLPSPSEVPEGTGGLGDRMLQVVATAQALAGLALLGAWVLGAVTSIVAPVGGLLFLVVGLFLFGVVANARLSDRFRAAEFRDRIRAVEAAGDRKPEFLPESVESGREGDETADGDPD